MPQLSTPSWANDYPMHISETYIINNTKIWQFTLEQVVITIKQLNIEKRLHFAL